MACEYQESDVIFSEHVGQGNKSSYYTWPSHLRKNSADRMDKNKKLKGNNSIISDNSVTPSSPICIPESDHIRLNGELNEKGWERGGGEVVPPHLIVAGRAAAGTTEFSVCSGRGRTLKGRDLKEVRDEILRMTGFLEA